MQIKLNVVLFGILLILENVFQICFIEMYNEHETLLFDMSNLSTHTSHNLLALETISDVSMCDTKLVLCLNYFI